MRSPLFLVISVILLFGLLVACGGAAEQTEEEMSETTSETSETTTTTEATPEPEAQEAEPEETPEAETMMEEQETPEAEATMEEESEEEQGESTATPAPAVDPALVAYAAQHANGPGAIYVGDINQLVGPAPSTSQGDFDGNVTLESLQRHLWIYDSDIY